LLPYALAAAEGGQANYNSTVVSQTGELVNG
jgi:hypothetical protein